MSNKTKQKENSTDVVEVENDLGIGNKELPDNSTQSEDQNEWKDVTMFPASFWKYDKEPEITGVYCGHGKTIGEGNKATKTHLLFMPDVQEFLMIPQWKALEPLNEIENVNEVEVFIKYKETIKLKDESTFHKLIIKTRLLQDKSAAPSIEEIEAAKK